MPTQAKIALAGNPNSGKTTLFNELTGSRQHVGNYPGVTVEKKEGYYLVDESRITIVDLPGTYSLTAYSVEEVVARDFLANEKPAAVINITDASNLERNLYLTCQFLELGIPLVIALNMIDVAKTRGIAIDHDKLSALLGVPVIPIIARSGKGTADLMRKAVAVAKEERNWQPIHISYGEDLDATLLEMQDKIEKENFLTEVYPARWVAMKYLEQDSQILEIGRRQNVSLSQELEAMEKTVSDHLLKTMETYPEAMIADHRYGFIKSILIQDVINQRFDEDRLYISDRIDKIVNNSFLGPLIMFGVLFGLYKFTFTFSEIPLGFMETFFTWLGGIVDRILPDGQLKSLFLSGIIDGVGGVLGFVPLIMFMFFGIAILEDSGYLARAAFMMDRIFRIFGLHGSSVMPFIVSGGIAGGCAVPGVLATRTLRSRKERLATLLTVSFMNCGAKVPVLALLTAVFFSENQARVLFLLTLLAWAVALLVAKFLRLTVLSGKSTPFVMELPPYRFPTFKGLLIHTWERTWQYIKKAGTVILGISILLWAMMTYPGLPATERDAFEQQRQNIVSSYAIEIAQAHQQTDNVDSSPAALEEQSKLIAIDGAQAEAALRFSLAGRIGTWLENITWLTGFDWRTNIALLGGFAAKEIIISTLGTAYSLGEVDPEETGFLRETLANNPLWNPAMGMALIAFIMFYTPCFATVICIVREAGSWKWGLFSMVFNTFFAFTLAALIYRLALFMGFGG